MSRFRLISDWVYFLICRQLDANGNTVEEQPAKSEPESVKSLFADFASSTSAHGLPRIADSKSPVASIIWLCVFLAGITMFFYLLTLLVLQFNRRPVSTSIDRRQEKVRASNFLLQLYGSGVFSCPFAHREFYLTWFCFMNPTKDNS